MNIFKLIKRLWCKCSSAKKYMESYRGKIPYIPLNAEGDLKDYIITKKKCHHCGKVIK